MEHGLAAYPGPKLNLKSKRAEDSAFRERPERPLKRARPSGLSTPHSPATEKMEDLYRGQKNIQAGWASTNLCSPIDSHLAESDGADEDIAVMLDLPEISEEVCENAARDSTPCKANRPMF